MAIGAILGKVLSSVTRGVSKVAKAGARNIGKTGSKVAKTEGKAQLANAGANLGGNAFSGLTKKLDDLGAPLERVTNAFGNLGATLLSSLNPLTAIGGALTQFVSQANPAIVKQYLLAVDGAMAAIGRAIMPVFRELVKVTQTLGKAFVFMLSSGDVPKLMQSIAQQLSRYGQVLIKYTIELGPTLISLASSFIELAVSLAEMGQTLATSGLSKLMLEIASGVVQALSWVIKGFNWFVNKISEAIMWLIKKIPGSSYILDMLPKRPSVEDFDPDKIGAPRPARDAQYMDVSSVLRKLDTASYGFGEDKQKSEEEKQTNILDDIFELLNKTIGDIRMQPASPTAPPY